ncbi:MAG: hypothetical protein H7Y88_12580, partial [Phycisphaerales bacterium]|nr:hypothetical protein [Phycisphaerales bacterium]
AIEQAAPAPQLASAEVSPASVLARKLREHTPTASAKRDPFSKPRAASTEAPKAEVDPNAEFITAFKKDHTLRSVMLLSDGSGLAVVGEKRLRIGDTLGDFILVSLTTRSAVFSRGELRIELTLESLGTGTDGPLEK